MQKVLTVLVLYKTGLHESAAFQSLTAAHRNEKFGGHLFVYDNSPTWQPISSSDTWTITYVHDPENPGVSKAYNAAFAHARKLDFDWILLSDQDTFFPPDTYSQYRLATMENPDDFIFAPRLSDSRGLVSPFRNGLVSGRRLHGIAGGRKSLTTLCAINSGLLIHVKAFEITGGYDERLRLDFSDFSFFDKLSKHFEFFVVVGFDCFHRLSAESPAKPKDALTRFRIYLEGSRITGRQTNRTFFFACYAVLRAIRLSWRYRSFRFMSSLLPATS